MPRKIFDLLSALDDRRYRIESDSAGQGVERESSGPEHLLLEPVEILVDLDCIMGDAMQLKQLLSRAQPLTDQAIGKCVGAIAKRQEIQTDRTENDVSSLKGVYEVLSTSVLSGGNSALDIDADVKELPNYSIEVFARVITEMKPGVNWNEVMKGIDYPELTLRGSEGFRAIVEFYSLVTQVSDSFSPVFNIDNDTRRKILTVVNLYPKTRNCFQRISYWVTGETAHANSIF